jgi:hypothetical protein
MGHYDPHASGLLKGGGLRRFKVRRSVIQGRRLKHFPDVHISDLGRVKSEVPDFDPALEFEYTQRELLLLAEKMLLEDKKPAEEHPVWLNVAKIKDRLKHEIYCANGIPDPSIVQGLYWRTHPNGRPWVPEDIRRATGSGFYGHTRSTALPIPPPPPKEERKDCSFDGCNYPAGNQGLCYSHHGQFKLGIPLRPVKRHVGKSKLAERLEAMVDRMAAKA